MEKELKIFVLDDVLPESDESVFVYLTEATGEPNCCYRLCLLLVMSTL